MADDVKITSGRGFKYITNFVIHETREQKIILDFKYIPDKDGSLHHVDLEIIKQTKKPSESWDQSQITKTILTTEKPRQSLIRLITALKAQEDLFDREDTRAIILNPEEADLFKQVGSNVAFLKKILESFDTPEAKEQLSKLDKDSLNNLFISVKHAKHKKSVEELRTLIADTVKEQAFQKWISENTWVFGTEYIKKYDTRKIGIHSEADFIVESLDGFTDLIELKNLSVKLFEYDRSRDCYYPSVHLSQVIGQAIHYIRTMEEHRHILKEKDDLDVLKPRVKVVIGRSTTLNQEEKKSLRLLNATLHGIEIITYDEIVSRAEKIISIYEGEE